MSDQPNRCKATLTVQCEWNEHEGHEHCENESEMLYWRDDAPQASIMITTERISLAASKLVDMYAESSDDVILKEDCKELFAREIREMLDVLCIKYEGEHNAQA